MGFEGTIEEKCTKPYEFTKKNKDSIQSYLIKFINFQKQRIEGKDKNLTLSDFYKIFLNSFCNEKFLGCTSMITLQNDRSIFIVPPAPSLIFNSLVIEATSVILSRPFMTVVGFLNFLNSFAMTTLAFSLSNSCRKPSIEPVS